MIKIFVEVLNLIMNLASRPIYTCKKQLLPHDFVSVTKNSCNVHKSSLLITGK